MKRSRAQLKWLEQFQRETDYLSAQEKLHSLLTKQTNIYLIFILLCVFSLGFVIGINLGVNS